METKETNVDYKKLYEEERQLRKGLEKKLDEIKKQLDKVESKIDDFDAPAMIG